MQQTDAACSENWYSCGISSSCKGGPMKRRAFIRLISGLAIAWPIASHAQQPKQPPKRAGVLASLVPCPLKPDDLAVRRLAELGWVEGQKIVFDCVSAVGRIDQVPTLARELVSRHPDVLMAGPYHFVSALKQETTTIPIVMLFTWEPVRLGLITSLAQPGGNVTGVAWFGLLPKQMELLKEIVPNLRRVAVIQGVLGAAYTPPEVRKIREEFRITASEQGFTLQNFGSRVPDDYDEIFARVAAEHFDAAYIPGTPFNNNNATRICQLALRHRIPTVSESSGWPKSCGLLLSYGQNFQWSVTRAMEYVDKILRGAKPSDLPVEQATKLELVVNLKTANTLGLTVPPSLIARADEVIE
jgi:putative tryptophan/tyrosine transport system substrate-binding protein